MSEDRTIRNCEFCGKEIGIMTDGEFQESGGVCDGCEKWLEENEVMNGQIVAIAE